MRADDTEGSSEAAEFLRRLAPEGSLTTFQTFGEPNQKRHLARVLHGTFTQHEARLKQLNHSGAGVFLMVNEGDGKGRRAENVRSVRAVFVDLDGAPLAPVEAAALPPHIVVQTSPNRYHAYWLVSDCPPEAFSDVQRALARRFHGDLSVNDLPRVMRMPGFDHRKQEPYRCRLIHLSDAPSFKLAQVVSELSLILKSETPKKAAGLLKPVEVIEEGSRNTALFTSARGFHSRGIPIEHGIKRVMQINTTRCNPPLTPHEVESVVESAYDYINNGYVSIPYAVFDSGLWKSLPHPARSIVLAAIRRHNVANNGNIALPYEELKTELGLSQNTFYKHRTFAVKAGFLSISKAANYGIHGGNPEATLFRIECLGDRKKW